MRSKGKNAIQKISLGFLVSSRGSNMHAIINNCKEGRLDAEPVLVISNNAHVEALEYARKIGLPALHLSTKTHPEGLDDIITDALQSYAVDWVILAGYVKKVGPRLLKEFKGKIFNIHPSLLPKHGGKGMFGSHVHKSVLASGAVKTGVTVHLVDDQYDQGKILAQISVPVETFDTPTTLATRVLQVEHKFYSQTLQEIIGGGIKL